jgi:catechol 2,3-dioxygenase-like lactoylglutathione lyase family enzyme
VRASAVPTLPSRDLEETLAFYARLGFKNRGGPHEEWGYLILGRGTIELHFFAEPGVDPLATAAGCYLRVPDADALHAEWRRIGVEADAATGSRLQQPVETEYGMREFALVDPSGNLLRVGSTPRRRAGRWELRDVAPGLWLWRAEHPDWHADAGWEPPVTSTVVESGGEIAVLDGLAPPDDARELWERLDARPPTLAVVLKPDHVRDVDLFAARYGARAFGPSLFWPDDVPETELEAIEPGSELPGGLVALYDGRGRGETPMWLPEQRALVFADALTAPGGALRVWTTPWHEERALPALRALLELPFEQVILSHGEPVHDRAAYERALELPPWEG